MAETGLGSGGGALAAVARELYARVPAEFVAARNARAAEVRRDGDRELADRVKGLPKASAAAWAVLALARENPEELDAIAALGAELRVAQAAADPAELRELGKRRRQLTAALTCTAARLADERDAALSDAAREQVEATLHAAVIHPDAERAVRSLLLVRPLDPGDPGALADAVAVPGAVPAVEEADGEPAPSPWRRGAGEGEVDHHGEPAPSPSRRGSGGGVGQEQADDDGASAAPVRASGRGVRRTMISDPSEEDESTATDGAGEVVWSKGGLTRRRLRDDGDSSTPTTVRRTSPRRDENEAAPARGPARRGGPGQPGSDEDASPPVRRRSGEGRPRQGEPTSAGTSRRAGAARTTRRGTSTTAAPSGGDVAREVRRVERQLRGRAAEQARTDLEEVKGELSRVEAEVLRVAARIEELRRELGKREEELAGLDEDRAVAQEEREDAEELAAAAERAVKETREHLAELTD